MASFLHSETLQHPDGPAPEQRRFERYDFSMQLQVVRDQKPLGHTLDVSREGARIATRDRLKVGEKLNLELYLSDNDPFPIRLTGECRWARYPDEEQTIAGLDLSGSNPRSLNVLQKFLSSLFH